MASTLAELAIHFNANLGGIMELAKESRLEKHLTEIIKIHRNSEDEETVSAMVNRLNLPWYMSFKEDMSDREMAMYFALAAKEFGDEQADERMLDSIEESFAENGTYEEIYIAELIYYLTPYYNTLE